MKAIICVGISGSGKSSWAENMVKYNTYPPAIINRDETRWKLTGNLGWNGPARYKFNKKIEQDVTDYNSDKMLECALLGFDIIIADTNLNPKTRRGLMEACKYLGYEVEIREFPISFQEACRRDKGRGIYAVGEAVLMKQWESWLKYHQDKGEGMWA